MLLTKRFYKIQTESESKIEFQEVIKILENWLDYDVFKAHTQANFFKFRTAIQQQTNFLPTNSKLLFKKNVFEKTVPQKSFLHTLCTKSYFTFVKSYNFHENFLRNMLCEKMNYRYLGSQSYRLLQMK